MGRKKYTKKDIINLPGDGGYRYIIKNIHKKQLELLKSVGKLSGYGGEMEHIFYNSLVGVLNPGEDLNKIFFTKKGNLKRDVSQKGIEVINRLNKQDRKKFLSKLVDRSSYILDKEKALEKKQYYDNRIDATARKMFADFFVKKLDNVSKKNQQFILNFIKESLTSERYEDKEMSYDDIGAEIKRKFNFRYNRSYLENLDTPSLDEIGEYL